MGLRDWGSSESAIRRSMYKLFFPVQVVTFTRQPVRGEELEYCTDRVVRRGRVAKAVERSDGNEEAYAVIAEDGRRYAGRFEPNLAAQLSAERERERQAYLAERERQRQQEERRKQAVYSADTGMGQCQQCGSRNIREFTEDVGGGVGGLQETACCLSCLFLPLLLVVPFLGRRPVYETHRRCSNCGHQWRV